MPLACEFGKYRKVIGYDIDVERVEELQKFHDITAEVSATELRDAKHLSLTSCLSNISEAQYYIVTVPTPVDDSKQPDLSALKKASEDIGSHMAKGDTVIFESTVFPGATEDICVPILEKVSGLEYNKDFYCGYSPERINPGDARHSLRDVVKVTSGSTAEAAQEIDDLYSEIILAGTHKASSIRVAEAAKVIENTQRDINIALMNELSYIFEALEINTQEVLQAASTKMEFFVVRARSRRWTLYWR